MTKQDLKSGMVVETREGKLYLVVDDFLTNDNGFLLLEEYDENLKDVGNKIFDIVKVYKRYNDFYENNAGSLKTLLNKDKLTLLWERKEITLTDKEKEVLKALVVLELNYIARDEDDSLYAFRTKPQKLVDMWNYFEKKYNERYHIELDREFFKFIKWEDENPTNIKELLK